MVSPWGFTNFEFQFFFEIFDKSQRLVPFFRFDFEYPIVYKTNCKQGYRKSGTSMVLTFNNKAIL